MLRSASRVDVGDAADLNLVWVRAERRLELHTCRRFQQCPRQNSHACCKVKTVQVVLPCTCMSLTCAALPIACCHAPIIKMQLHTIQIVPSFCQHWLWQTCITNGCPIASDTDIAELCPLAGITLECYDHCPRLIHVHTPFLRCVAFCNTNVPVLQLALSTLQVVDCAAVHHGIAEFTT